jgi:CRP-like cAMP-binding protein
MTINRKRAFHADAFLRSAGSEKTIVTYQPTEVIFSQGDRSDTVLYIQEGAPNSLEYSTVEMNSAVTV